MQATGSRNDVVGIVGAGLMGRGIAQITAQAGFDVRLVDAKPGAAADAQARHCGRARHARRERQDRRRKRRCRGRTHRAARDARRTRRLFDRDRSDRRTTRREAGTVPGAGSDRWRPVHPGNQHVVTFGHGNRERMRASRARRWIAFLQPRPADETRRGHRRPAHDIPRRSRGCWTSARHSVTRRSGPRTRRDSSSITPAEAMAPKRCASPAKASRNTRRSTAYSSVRRVFAWGHSNCSTSPGSMFRIRSWNRSTTSSTRSPDSGRRRPRRSAWRLACWGANRGEVSTTIATPRPR